MAITINIIYSGHADSALKFAREMISSGTVDAIRAEPGNLRYEYYVPLDGGGEVLLIDSWRDQDSLDVHHASPMMARIAELRDRYDLHMRVTRYADAEAPARDAVFTRQ